MIFIGMASLGSVKAAYLSIIQAESSAPATLIATLFSLMLGFGTVANAAMLLVLLVFMTLDIGVALNNVRKNAEHRFREDSFFGGVLGKLARLSLVAVGGGLDLVFSVNFPNTGEVMKLYTPVTKFTLSWLIAAEGISIVRNVRSTEGEGVIPSIIIRSLDRLKLGGREPPIRRAYDREAVFGEDMIRSQIQTERKEDLS